VKPNKKSRIGIFGGLFDPPHIAHCIIAQWVLEEFNLEKVIFIPAAHPPHKLQYSPFEIRYHMMKLAIKNNKKFFVSNIEKKIPGKTYTIDVIKAFKQNYKGEFFLIIGSDQWQEIETWKLPAELLHECTVIVVPRPGYPVTKRGRFSKKILISQAPLIDISSTAIRKRIKKKCDITYLVPHAVLTYIRTKKLYR
jgi:nicotinate-nucleotide adenylyltransferase